jgi:Recombination endonuclease VII
MEYCVRGHEKCSANQVKFPSQNRIVCRLCHNEDAHKAQIQMKRAHPERWKNYIRDRNLRKRFRLSVEAYEAISKLQNHKCLGCEKHRDEIGLLVVDHDHNCCPDRNKTCGKCIRGLLCAPCNNALGLVKNNASTLRNLAQYLEAYRGFGKN